ncbi:fibrinogen-like protein 1 [Drosophila novamexicana]|uniref:fibrinogen-like protein 1 n=1 Tax=Drosophila novamexicana TaxID=47314 RepID=UPI0011E59443|nr:fibrinogen-like protein 1 [Drosophila novamexicana]
MRAFLRASLDIEMYRYLCAVFFTILILFLSVAATSASEDHWDDQARIEKECAPYCLKVFLWNTVNMNQKIEACDKKNEQMAALQSQLAVSKVKETMYEKTIREKNVHCKSEEQLYADVSSIKHKIDNMAAQTQSESKLLQILKQLEDYRVTLELKNEQIRSLETKLQISEYLLENCKANFTASPADLMIMDSKREADHKVFETSCLQAGNSSDIREIQVPGAEAFRVPCDGRIAGPGWMVIQRRVDKSVDFNRGWAEYRTGFGDLEGNFFIGLEKLYRMTNSQPHELYIYLENFENEIRFARYDNFSIASEEDAYQLKVLGKYSGDAGDALMLNRNMKFTTFDRDNDKRDFDNCAIERHSGWWYSQCARSNLNGRYFERELDKWEGIWWWNWQETRTLKSVQMLIRPTINSTETN